MKHTLLLLFQEVIAWVVVGSGVLASPVLLAQPTVVGLTPARNASIARNGQVKVAFSKPLLPGSAAALRLLGTQREGQKAGLATVNATELSFQPTTSFLPGEKVWLTLNRTQVHDTSRVALAKSQVWQLTAAATGGTGQFAPGAVLEWARPPLVLATGDVDGDGDVDVMGSYNANGSTSTSVLSTRLNDGTGTYVPAADRIVPYNIAAMAVGDVDNDGDLDIVTSGFQPDNGYSYYSMQVNNGQGCLRPVSEQLLQVVGRGG